MINWLISSKKYVSSLYNFDHKISNLIKFRSLRQPSFINILENRYIRHHLIKSIDDSLCWKFYFSEEIIMTFKFDFFLLKCTFLSKKACLSIGFQLILIRNSITFHFMNSVFIGMYVNRKERSYLTILLKAEDSQPRGLGFESLQVPHVIKPKTKYNQQNEANQKKVTKWVTTGLKSKQTSDERPIHVFTFGMVEHLFSKFWTNIYWPFKIS